MKKKITALCLCVALLAVAVVGASLAYFTDTDSRDNVFTTGSVKIELIEKQRNGEGGLEDFVDGKILLPIVGSAQDEKDELGLSTAKNYVDKIVTVKNLAVDAYVRVYMAIPSALFNLEDETHNVLHVNQPGKETFVGLDGTTQNKWDKWTDMAQVGTYTDADGVEYVVVCTTYADVLTKDEIAGCAAFVGVYLDKGVDCREIKKDDGTVETVYTIKIDNEEMPIDYDLSKGVTLPVFAVGVQADGFTSADEAIEAAFGANYNPWAA